jgi:branched-chain amino acid transport system ATP-binding protein
MTMLSISGLRVQYGNTVAVDGLDLPMAASGALALLGANGAGKSSTLKAVSGLVPYEGEIVFDGVSLRGMSPERIARLGLIHVPEGRRLFGNLTVLENLRVGMTARGRRGGGYSIGDVFDLFPALREIPGQMAWTLSGGQQQMVSIGRALVGNPRLIMLDEPSLGLSPLVSQTVYEALRQIAAQTPVLLVEQNFSAALRICDQAVVLANGRSVYTGDVAGLEDGQLLQNAYFGPSESSAKS